MSSSYRYLSVLAFCGLAALGCSHETESPKPTPAELPAAENLVQDVEEFLRRSSQGPQ